MTPDTTAHAGEVVPPPRAKSRRPECGTLAAVQYHRTHGERVCPDCCAAANTHLRLWRLQKRGPAGAVAAVLEARTFYAEPSRERWRTPASQEQIAELVDAVCGPFYRWPTAAARRTSVDSTAGFVDEQEVA